MSKSSWLQKYRLLMGCQYDLLWHLAVTDLVFPSIWSVCTSVRGHKCLCLELFNRKMSPACIGWLGTNFDVGLSRCRYSAFHQSQNMFSSLFLLSNKTHRFVSVATDGSQYWVFGRCPLMKSTGLRGIGSMLSSCISVIGHKITTCLTLQRSVWRSSSLTLADRRHHHSGSLTVLTSRS